MTLAKSPLSPSRFAEVLVRCFFTGLLETMGDIGENFFLDDKWEALVETIETGKLPSDLQISNESRHELDSKLRPNLNRAQELRRVRLDHAAAFQNDTGDKESSNPKPSLARRIWPTLHTILSSRQAPFKYMARNSDSNTLVKTLQFTLRCMQLRKD